MATDLVTISPAYNGDTVPLTRGHIVRLKSAVNNNVVRAQGDTAAHIQAVNGVVAQGAAAPGSAVLVACIGRQLVQMEPGLTLKTSDIVYVSASTPGKGTNVLPAQVAAIGFVADASMYSSTGMAAVDVSPGSAVNLSVVGGGVTSGVVSTSIGRNPETPSGITVDPIAADGVTDDTAALKNWIASVPAGAGAEIILPAGSIRITSPIVVDALNGINLHGRGRRATTILIDDTAGNLGDALTFRNTNGCRVHDMSISAKAQRTAGRALVSEGGQPGLSIAPAYNFGRSGLSIERIDLDSQFGGFAFIDTPGTPPLGNWISYLDDCVALNCADDAFLLAAPSGASHFVRRFFAYNNPSAGAAAGIHCVGSGDFNFEQCETFGTGYGVLIDPPSTGFLGTGRFSNCFFDSAGVRTGYINLPTGISYFGDLEFSGCWFATSQEHGMLVSGAGANFIRFLSSTFIHNVGFGLVYNGCSYVTADGSCTFAANGSGGVLFTAAAKHCAVRSSVARSTTNIASATQPVGVQLNLGCDFCIVAMNDLHDNTTALMDASGGANNILAPNVL